MFYLRLLMPIIVLLCCFTPGWTVNEVPAYWDTLTKPQVNALGFAPKISASKLLFSYCSYRASYDGINYSRLYLCDSPEKIYLGTLNKLWEDYSQAAKVLEYHLFMLHPNNTNQDNPIYAGVVIQNLTPATSLTVTGVRYGGSVTESLYARAAQEISYSMLKYPVTVNTLYNNYAIIDSIVVNYISPYKLITYFTIPDKEILYSEMILKIESKTGPVRCRLATVWGETEADLLVHGSASTQLAKLALHQRGTWCASALALNNDMDSAFDVGENVTSPEKWLLIADPKSYTPNKEYGREIVPFSSNISFNPTQAYANRGLYGVWTNVYLYAKNTSNIPRSFNVYLSRPLLGSVFQGALTIITTNPKVTTTKAFILNDAYPMLKLFTNILLPAKTTTPVLIGSIRMMVGAESTLPISIIFKR